MNFEREEIVSICDSEVDSCPQFLEQAVNIMKEKPKTARRHDDTKKIDGWLSQLLFVQLSHLGALPEKGVLGEKTTLRKEAGIIDKYDAWWTECLNNLEAGGYLRQLKEGQVKVVSEGEYDQETVWEKWESAKQSLFENFDNSASLGLCESCLRSLQRILRGEVPATDIMFPRSSMDKVKNIYSSNTTNDHFNGVLAELVQAYIKQRIDADSMTRLRIIEIGAGTGGTTAMILPKLRSFAGNIEEYCYTDISKAFLFFAEDKFGPENPYLSYNLWDIEKPLAEQDIEIGGFDLVIATNVLHATKNIRQTLRNAKAALCRNGLILINEISAKSLILHLTFGLLDGWWLFEDIDLRMPGCPGLYPETWKRIMEEEGFHPVMFPAEEAHQFGQQIILAQSDGIVKQRTVAARDDAAPVYKEKDKENGGRLYSVESSIDTRAYIEKNVLICLSETLRIDKDEIDFAIPFSEYGVDSILGVGFIDRVNECFSITMNTAIIFDYSSVDGLTNYIHDTYKDQIKDRIRDKQKSTREPSEQSQNIGEDVPKKIIKKTLFKQRKNEFITSSSKKSTKITNLQEIAIIGMSGQFPKATDVNQFWSNLIEEIDGVDELPSHYLDKVRFYSPEKEFGKTYCKWGGILENRACFDPSFFNISPKEAQSMNPHQRLILQESWKALEDAGYNPRSLGGSKVAVYVGAEPTGYAHGTFTGTSEAIIASRISYYLNLNGPAMVVNTGCSSSAVAIHLACESLRSGESRLALAGGVNATLSQSVLVSLSAMEMLSPTGKCRTFDDAGNGTVISEGVGMVLLKRLEDAVYDNDPIYGTICGSGVNQDGASNSITAPNGLAQERLIKDVYERYEINPEDISYFEAHGTGTKLGDPVEANALIRAFKHFTNKKSYCAIGSAKSHVGHTAAASGVVGLMKVLLSIKYHKIPKHLNFNKINSLIELEDSAFYINTVLSEWESKNYKPLMAALNSFGHSGTNAHLVIREYVASAEILESATIMQENVPVLIPLSAKAEKNLKDQAEQLKMYLGHTLPAQSSDQVSGDLPDHEIQNPNLADIAYTLQVGREPMAQRVIFLVQNVTELNEKLQAFCEGREDILNCWKGQVEIKKNTASFFSLDEDVNEVLITWIKKLKLEKIARAWVQGLMVDWNLFYKENKPNRISLPSYPFAKESYWISQAKERQEVEYHANQQPTESLNALKTPKVEFTHRKLSNKPNSISLQFLSDDNILTKKQDDQLRPSETLIPASVSAETVIMDGPENDFHLQSTFTKESIQQQLKKSLAAALWVQVGDVDVDKTFVDMGLDSIIAVEWIREINKHYNIKINVSKIYDYSTIRELSVFLEEEANKQDVALRPSPSKSTSPPEKFTNRKLSNKPNNISLQFLSDDNILTKKQDDQLRPSETLIPASVSSETVIMDGPEYDFHFQSTFTKESIQEQLKKSLATALWVQVGDVDVDKTFVDMGLDSIIAVEWIREINKHYNIKINVSKIYDYSTIRELSVFLEEEANKQDVALRPSPSKSTSPPEKFTHRKLSNKPNNISLQFLSDDNILTKKQDDQLRPSETLIPASVSAETVIMDGPENDLHLQSTFTKESIQQQLKKSLAAALWVQVGDVDVDKTYVDLGLDSIIAVEWIREINKQYNIKINVSKIYDYSTVRELSVLIEKEANKQEVALRPSSLNSASPLSVDNNSHEVKIDNLKTLERKVVKSEKSTIPKSSNQKAEPVGGAYHTQISNYKDLIAVVGMSGRYPDANDLAQYWDNLVNGINSIREIPKSRWDVQKYYDPRPYQRNKIYCKWLGGLDDIEYFDPLFFNISPTEAEGMDPQHRLFLQEGYKAFEDAGYSRNLLNNRKCGVYLGISNNEYGMNMYQNQAEYSNVTGNSFAIAAARIAYYLNLKGPAMPIDTACSSSLVATHLACQALANHEIDMALVGGVSIYLTPESYIGMCAAGMLSASGQCKTFDNNADGFVPGEGIGALVLKRLKDAEDNHNFIYGVIVGSGINQDGKTNGITAPSVKSQIELEREVYDRYQIDPESIGYVEMHGTGTKLGDPIELEALSTVFKERSSKKNYCAIGSVKTNIGHSSAAAGVASMQKVLLSLKNKKIPPTLNFKHPNEHFDFKDSSFYVNTDLKFWEAFSGAPRRAAISSFSFSGTNAHIVVEEYTPPVEALSLGTTQPARGQMIVLSAKDDERLQDVAKNLHVWLARQPALSNNDLSSIAYTLQMGREAMETRLGLIVKSADELREKLSSFLDGEENIVGLYRGRVKRENDALTVFAADEDLQKAIDAWIGKGKYHKLLDLWVKGLVVDWHKLYGENIPQRISLPTYPFAKERCWVSSARDQQETGNYADLPQLHPLVHHNTSILSEQRFTSTFSGEEFFLDDHRVKGNKVLPGVAYLEMARAAITQAIDSTPEGIPVMFQLENIVWARPLIVDGDGQALHIGLYPEAEGRIGYEVYTQDENNESEPVMHSQGLGALVQGQGAATLDLADLKERIRQPGLAPIQYYDAFKSLGLAYGEAFQGIEALTIGEHEVLARILLPDCVKDTKASFVLHPSLMDAALQSSIGLGDPSASRPALPFALERLTILSPCNDSMWAWVRPSKNNGSASNRVLKLDMDLCDDAGSICVQLKGFSSRVLEGELGKPHGQGKDVAAPAMDLPAGLLHLSPVWNVVPKLKEQRLPINAKERVVVIGASKTQSDGIKAHYPQSRLLEIKADESHGTMVERFKAQGAIDHIIWIVPEDGLASVAASELIDAQQRGVLLIFKAIKAVLALDYADRELAWTVITTQTQAVWRDDPVNPAHAAVQGLVGALAKEYPHWRIRLADLAAGAWPIQEILTLPYDEQGNGLAFRDNAWFTQKLLPVRKLPEASSNYKQGGVYVIIGGAGGLGEVWSRWMIKRYQARIIWIGRRVEDADIKAKRRALSQIGEPPLYIQADATDHQALESAYRQIKSVHAHIHGVVHAAIVLLDKSLAQMDEQRFKKALAAKVDVSVSLAQVFDPEPLDFVLFFSSLQSFFKAPGQSNYAAGCTFKDAFAHRLAQDWRCAVKIMNWGFWGSVGAVADPVYSQRIARLGIGSIEPQEGMEALEALLTSSLDQMALIQTLKPNALQGVDAEEWLSEHSSVTETDIEALCNELDQDQHMDGTKHTVRKDARQDPQDDKIVYQLLLSHLQALGLLDPRPAGGILTKGYERWLETSITFLQSQGYVTQKGADGVVVDAKALWAQWDRRMNAWRKDPVLGVQVDLLDACLRALPDILTGKRPAVEVVFPDSSTALVEGIYKGNPVADFFNERLGETLVAYVRRRLEQDRDVELRILEIGAGTGGTTAGLLEKLEPFKTHIKEYGYTDLSKAFLLHAQKHYASEHPYLKTQIFDVAQPLASQGIEAGGYDVVIAANVLHATRDICRTLRNCKAALRKGGLILLNELSGTSLFSHLTFGLLEGWWLYQDSYLRIPGSPGLYPETWAQVLKAEGFYGTFFAAEKEHALGQQIIAAQSNGVVRQRQALPLPMKKEQPIRIENVPETSAAKLSNIPAKELSEETLKDKGRRYLTHIVAQGLGMKSHDLNASTPLESYGLDSILVVQLTDRLRRSFDNISSTLFFEVQTIEGLVDHLIRTQKHAMMRVVGAEENAVERKTEGEIPDSDAIVRQAKYRVHGARRLRPAHHSEGIINNANGHGVEDIAIIGLSGRYPDAKDVDEFWRNLTAGKNCIREIPEARWDWKAYFDEEKGKPGKIYSKWGGFLDEVDTFDPLFFQISPREAELMDPQERLFIEEAYKSIEDTGYTAATLSASGEVGVFVGVMNSTYAPQSSHWSIANRISYLLNFQGPSLAVDTACSSSLTAIHLALESLYGGKCDCAIAGGVNLILKPVHYQLLSSAMMLSATSECKSFGNHADGFVDGEGVGVVVLKPLKKAVQDKDHIYGVIKASAINHGGKTNGYTVPNPKAQQSAIARALKEAQIDPRAVSYIEAHGTGTSLGDPIEIAALSRAFGRHTDQMQYCAIGSVKSNIGHCEAAAGIAGLTKVLLQMRHKKLVPSLHSKELNPNIDFAETPFVVNQKLKDWRAPEIDGKRYGRIAGVSSFGAGGSNAHMVVEEYSAPAEAVSLPKTQPKATQIFVLSAKNDERLKAVAKSLHTWLSHRPELSNNDLASIAYTLQVGREAMAARLGLIVHSVDELREKIDAFLDGEENIVDLYSGRVKRENDALAVFTADEDLQKAIEAWFDKGKYHKLLDLWVKGLVIDWNKLYAEHKPGRISLPTYPFAKERYWVSAAKFPPETDRDINQSQLHPSTSTETALKHGRRVEMRGFTIAQCVALDLKEQAGLLLKMDHNMLDESLSFIEFGFDSVLLAEFARALTALYGVKVTLALFFNYSTIKQLGDYLLNEYGDRLEAFYGKEDVPVVSLSTPAPEFKHPRHSVKGPGFAQKRREISPVKETISLSPQERFPELIKLNESVKGRPVFWFHGGLGGVGVYSEVAEISQRPFYGIEARGYRTKRLPLHGVQAMAAYYIQVLQSLMPEGPYDLGGYSFGGILTYEVARQLQELGYTVDTIIMIDSFDSFPDLSYKTLVLQNANNLLIMWMAMSESKITIEKLIRREELDLTLDDKKILNQLCRLVQERGFKMAEAELIQDIHQKTKVQVAYEINNYPIFPLLDSSAINCYYFRNKNGQFFGELEPYLYCDDAAVELDYKNLSSSETWRAQLSNFHLFDLKASDHFTLLHDPEVSETIKSHCRALYSGETLLPTYSNEC